MQKDKADIAVVQAELEMLAAQAMAARKLRSIRGGIVLSDLWQTLM